MKSPNLSVSEDDEGLEDGEIVSDDFEAISDDSIVFTPHGKSRTRKDPLPDLSLSSVSETEEQDRKLRRKRRRSHNKRRTNHKKRRRTISPSLDKSDSESIPDLDLQLKLKAAVQVGSQEAHRNSLRTRLKAIMKEACPETDRQTPEVVDSCKDGLHDVALVTGSGSEFESEGFGGDNAETDDTSAEVEELDSELIQLRLEALKTAVQNKFANKIRKKKESQVSDETNKENNNVSSETGSQENKNGDKVVNVPVVNSDSTDNTPISPDEDEDILRALLLASMSNKITKNPSNDLTKTVAPKIQTNVVSAKVPASKTLLTKINNFKLNNNFKTAPKKPVQAPIKNMVTPQVKPLIICLNDSDSDTEFSNSPEKISTNGLTHKATAPVEKEIENSVEKFLKEQRARAEALVKPVAPKPVNKTPPQRITLYNNKKPSNPQTPLKTNLPKSLEKSALKFLPAKKREEYKRLQILLRQKKAQMRKNKVRRNSIIISDGDPSAVIISDIKSKISLSVNNTNLTNPAKTLVGSISKPVIAPNTHKVTTCTSRATQTVNTCKLFTSKLEERVNEFRQQEEGAARREQEKKMQSALLRNILKQLQSRRNGRLQIEERYKCLRPLVKTLNQISKEQKQCNEEVERLLRELSEARTRQQQVHDNLVKSVGELVQGKEKIDSSSSEVAPLLPLNTSTPIKPPTQIDTCSNNNSSSSTLASDISKIQTEEEAEPTKDCRVVSVTDPNDIDTIIKDAERRSAELEKCKKAGINQYISPLMDCSRRKDGFDPFGILCPFEVNGKCRDPDCGYNHLPK